MLYERHMVDLQLCFLFVCWQLHLLLNMSQQQLLLSSKSRERSLACPPPTHTPRYSPGAATTLDGGLGNISLAAIL